MTIETRLKKLESLVQPDPNQPPPWQFTITERGNPGHKVVFSPGSWKEFVEVEGVEVELQKQE